MIKPLLRSFLLLVLPVWLCAQAEIGGIVNRYAAVEDIEFCSAQLLLSSSEDFAAGDDILIIQMKGARLSIEESPAFGDLLDPGQAGRFERARISTINGNRLTLENALLHEYDPTGQVQVVSIPVYEEANVVSTLQAPGWNGATGGVLIIEVNGVLELEADINLSETGFRGGLSDVIQDTECNFLTAVRDYGVERNSWRGAPKGEGIGVTLDRENGRGAQGNGGGGGNDHNAGGGGGANSSPGGSGGENRQSGFGCDGAFPGLGGKAAPIDSARLFMGGGGGGGHENNDNGSDGGHGGGILLLFANTIVGNDQVIRSNGGSPALTTGDGGGGGGAGGTIVIQAQQIDGPLRVEALGGDGGSIDNRNENRCFGPGGGGSGGRVLSNRSAALNTDVRGGSPGQSINSSSCGDGPNGAQAGTEGLITPFAGLPQSEERNEAPAIVSQPSPQSACPGDSLRLTLETTGAGLQFQWQIDRGNGFALLEDDDTHQGTQSATLTLFNLTPGMDGYRYRLLLSTDCFEDIISEPVLLTITGPPEARFEFTQQGSNLLFDNRSAGADRYEWNFGDGSTSDETSPAYSYQTPGEYTVTLVAVNACGRDTSRQTINAGQLPAAAFTFDQANGCSPHLVRFSDASTGLFDQYEWQFPGGDPTSSNDPNPQVIYRQAGVYSVTLRIQGALGASTVTRNEIIRVQAFPEPVFDFEITGPGEVRFINRSSGAESYRWEFGDGQVSEEEQPVHTYNSNGVFEVTLNAQNGSCASATSRTVAIILTGRPSPALPPGMKLFPNPSSGLIYLETDHPGLWPLQCRVFSAQGRKLLDEFLGKNGSLDLSQLPAGTYLLQLQSQQRTWVSKISIIP